MCPDKAEHRAPGEPLENKPTSVRPRETSWKRWQFNTNPGSDKSELGECGFGGVISC